MPTLASRSRTIAADTLTPIGALAALAAPGAACLLESVESGGRISRYSFLGVDYLDARSFVDDGNMLANIRSFVNEHRKNIDDPDGRGGALVAFSYDAARSFARLPARGDADPPMPAAYVALPATWLIFDHFSDELTIWTCGSDASELDAKIDSYIERLLTARPALPAGVRGSEPVRCSMDRSQFLDRAREVKENITDGEVYQLQLGIRFTAPLQGSAFDLYRAIRSRNPSPYMFYVDAPFGQLLGASPEFLVRLEGRKARIRPLAGTRPRGVDESADLAIAAELLSNEKERAEHVMLVDLGRNDLGAVCEFGSVKVVELLQLERYSHVMHIVSDVTGTLRPECDALDLFAAGFPAGTVTGTPKIRAMQLIDQLEPVARGFYAGSVGRWAHGGDFDSCITLRSMHVQGGNAHWQASAGIVADSDPEAEYDEIMSKTEIARVILSVSKRDAEVANVSS
ncbi:MAG TPA: anthranilate synthase component I family protein [Candidatus Rubrimentiphilum sp.]|nr:anthranilate synthase component I family protein [Candidatus Rubrimentiphilum sp.]